MANLIHQTGGESLDRTRKAWQESMQRQLGRLRQELSSRDRLQVADRCGAQPTSEGLRLQYWTREVVIDWPDLAARYADDDQPCPVFDQAMLLYYLHQADGSPLEHRWIGFRELPGGTFYNQAFQSYSGDVLGRTFGQQPQNFHTAANRLGGTPLPDITEYAYAFQPFPRIRLAAVLWPGDEDFPARGQILFDRAASRYMITDGLALLGSGLVRRLANALG